MTEPERTWTAEAVLRCAGQLVADPLSVDPGMQSRRFALIAVQTEIRRALAEEARE